MLCNVISLGRDLSHPGSTISTGQMGIDSISLRLIIAHQAFYILSNTISELVLLYRVYVIWSSRVVTIIPSIFILADLVVGLAGTFMHTEASQTETSIILFRIVFMVLNFVTNLMLTMLLAFKICHIGRHALEILGLDVAKRYKTIVAIIFESGIMYPLALLLFLILEARSMSSDGISSGMNSGSSSVVYEILPFIVAIAPTLVLVRSWLGLCVVHLDQTISLYQSGARGDEGELSERKVAANLPEGCTICSTEPNILAESPLEEWERPFTHVSTSTA
ncbi:hypothetical protein VNI00_007238 [Paramarasmius palmivorus]|uniref:Uncharacterized protein n=1 Tax=Paramarasmius palmivorus TaxID=297713 RepID=A0AAW0D6B6_9AGAR